MFFEQGTHVTSPQDEPLVLLIQAFLETKKAENVTTGTLTFYRNKLALFHTFCTSQGINLMQDISPATIRQFLLFLQERGNNDGGIHAHFRTVKTLLKWYENEFEPENWHNPIKKIKAPKVAVEPLDPANYSDIEKMLKACGKDMIGRRNRAIMFFLIDTGTRANEMLSVSIADINLMTGEVLIRSGKGRKPRYVFLGEMARRSIRQYLKLRTDPHSALWITDDGEGPLSYWGLKSEMRRLAARVHVPCPPIHGFRRLWTLKMIQSGKSDLLSISRLGGWANIQMLQRYAKQSKDDLKEKAPSLLDHMGGNHEA